MRKVFYLSTVCSVLLTSQALAGNISVNANAYTNTQFGNITDNKSNATTGSTINNGTANNFSNTDYSFNSNSATVTATALTEADDANTSATASGSATGLQISNTSTANYTTSTTNTLRANNNTSSASTSSGVGIDPGTLLPYVNSTSSASASAVTYGIAILGSSHLNTTNMNIEANNNTATASGNSSVSAIGFYVDGTSQVNIEGDEDLNNTFKANNNTVSGTSTDSGGVVSLGTMTFKNMNVEANSNTRNGMEARGTSGHISFENTNITTNSNTGAGLASTGGANVEIKNSNITANSNNTGLSITNNSHMKIEGETKDIKDIYGNITGQELANEISVNNNAGGGFNVNGVGAILDISDMKINGQGNNVIVVNNGTMILNGSTLDSSDNSMLIVYNGGVADISDTIINGGMVNNTPSSMLEIKDGSIWTPLANFNIRNFALTDSYIDLTSDAMNNTLTFNQNYIGDNGHVDMNMDVGSNQRNDQIIIGNGGHAQGDTTLHFYNQSDLTLATTGEGMKIIDAQGSAIIDDGAFKIAGGMWDDGALEYRLNRGTNGSLFLQSGGLSNTAKAIGNAADITMIMAKTGSNELRKRLGELRDNSFEDGNGVWARAYGKQVDLDDLAETSIDMYGVEAGYDRRIYTGTYDRIYLGVMAGYLQASNIDTTQTNAYNGEGDGDAPSVGIYATYLTNNGWFADATLRSFWTNIDMTSYNSTGMPIDFSPDRQIMVASLEGGKQFEYRINQDAMWLFEPKAELIYGLGESTDFRTSNGYNAEYDDTQSIVTKLSVMVAYNRYFPNRCLVLEPFVQAGIWNEFDGKTDVRFAGVDYETDMSGVGFEVGGGLNAQLNMHTSMYMDVMYEKSSVIDGISASLGLRRTW